MQAFAPSSARPMLMNLRSVCGCATRHLRSPLHSLGRAKARPLTKRRHSMTRSPIQKRSLAKWIMAAVVALFVSRYAVYSAPLPFVASWWNANNSEWDDPLHKRARIADRLISRQVLIGKTKLEITQMLGDPPLTGYFRDWDMVYNLGAERGFFSIDSEWLVVRLGSSGSATEAAIVRD